MNRLDLAELWLVRHGETEWNRIGRRQGQLDSKLTMRGLKHAEAMAQTLSQTAADSVYSSPLGRARATAAPIATRLGVPVVPLDDLQEVHHGEFAGKTTNEIEAQWPGVLEEREQNKYRWRFPAGESYEDAAERIDRAVDEIGSRHCRRPVIVAHEMVGRLIIGRVLELSPGEALEWSLPHGHIVRIDPILRTAAVQSS